MMWYSFVRETNFNVLQANVPRNFWRPPTYANTRYMSKSELLYDRMREKERPWQIFQWNWWWFEFCWKNSTKLLLLCIISKIQYIHGFEFADRPLCEQIHPVHIKSFFCHWRRCTVCLFSNRKWKQKWTFSFINLNLMIILDPFTVWNIQ